jgi:hypothetical protein
LGKDVKQAKDSTYFSIGTSDGGGYGSSSVHIMRHSSTGFYLAGPSMGGSNAQFGNSVAIGKNGDILFAGATSSYGNGGFDVYDIRLTSDSMIQNYTQVFTNYKDTPVVEGIAAPSSFAPGIKVYPNPAITGATVLVQTITPGTLSLNLYNNSGMPVYGDYELNSTLISIIPTNLVLLRTLM